MIYGKSTAPPRRAKNDLIVGVGSHAHINWRQPPDESPSSVPVMDGYGRPVESDLVDGEEVEIVSWRQRSRAGATYQVRRLSDGREWWIGASHLRRERVRVEPALGPQS